MSVLDNVAYGLKISKVAARRAPRRAQEALEMVRLPDVGGRRPAQLSGGQRQRVALARAIVNRPRVLLLDEPLGALDLKLREEMQVELKRIQHEVGITFVYVTHDQDEALSMSDRIAVFNEGQHRAGRHARRGLRAPRERVRRRLRRRLEHARARRASGSRSAPRRSGSCARARAPRACTSRPGTVRRRELRRPGTRYRDRARAGAGACSSRHRTSRRRTTRPAICAGVRSASDGARTRRSPSAAEMPHEEEHA